jgi:hypothetical protein
MLRKLESCHRLHSREVNPPTRKRSTFGTRAAPESHARRARVARARYPILEKALLKPQNCATPQQF